LEELEAFMPIVPALIRHLLVRQFWAYSRVWVIMEEDLQLTSILLPLQLYLRFLINLGLKILVLLVIVLFWLGVFAIPIVVFPHLMLSHLLLFSKQKKHEYLTTLLLASFYQF
jgi:hypothetical protein